MEWLIVWAVVATLGALSGWFVALNQGIKVTQTQIQNNEQYQILNSGQVTYVEGNTVYKNVRFILTNVENPYALFDSMTEFQKRETVIVKDGNRYLFKFPVVELESKTNTSIYASTNKTNY